MEANASGDAAAPRCENCAAAHAGTYGSGRFCSLPCRSRFNGQASSRKCRVPRGGGIVLAPSAHAAKAAAFPRPTANPTPKAAAARVDRPESSDPGRHVAPLKSHGTRGRSQAARGSAERESGRAGATAPRSWLSASSAHGTRLHTFLSGDLDCRERAECGLLAAGRSSGGSAAVTELAQAAAKDAAIEGDALVATAELTTAGATRGTTGSSSSSSINSSNNNNNSNNNGLKRPAQNDNAVVAEVEKPDVCANPSSGKKPRGDDSASAAHAVPPLAALPVAAPAPGRGQYRGTVWDAFSREWQAVATDPARSLFVSLGSFPTAEEAARTYDAHAPAYGLPPNVW
jgi:hypothetical protein